MNNIVDVSRTLSHENQQTSYGDPRKDYLVVLLFLTTFLLLFCLFSLRSTLSLYIQTLGGKTTNISLSMTLLTISSVLVRPFAGKLVDLYGARYYYWTAGILAILAPVFHIFNRSLLGAGLVSCVVGFAHGLIMTASVSLFLGLSNTYGETRMVNLSGLTVVSTTALAPLVAIPAYSGNHIMTLYEGLAILSLLGLILSFYWMKRFPAGGTKTENFRALIDFRPLKNRNFIAAFLTYVTWATTYGAIITFLPLYGNSRSLGSVGVFFTAYSVFNISIRSQMPRIMEKVSRKMIVTISLMFISLSLFRLIRLNTIWDLFTAGCLYGIGSSGIYTPLACQVVESTDIAGKTSAMGMFMPAIEVGQSIGAILLSSILRAFSYQQMFITVAFIPILGIVIYLGIDPKRL